MPLSPGDQLGPYEILSAIGAGGMGEVYKARDPRLKRDVAIKQLKSQHTARFQQEAQAIAALNHANICQIYDIGPDYLVMEYIEGKALSGPLSVEAAVKLAVEIAGAIEEAHSKNILHRDLKPANILVTARGSAKLLDFGLAKLLKNADSEVTQTAEGAIAGTVSYMSPEQARGEAIDARSDIFSFGAVLYELLSGRRAFTGGSGLDILSAVIRDEPGPLDTPPDLADLVRRCLRKQRGERFGSMAEVGAALQAVGSTPAKHAAGMPQPQPSIAVLPFANLSSDKENEYFSDGLAEEILNALTTVPGLRVVARASTFSFRGRENAVREIGAVLKVSSVLCGSVRRSGNRIRVSAQLIDVRDESQLWSERYDREMLDVFDIQDEIAQAIVQKLKVQLGARSGQPLVKRYTDDPEVHSLYLRGIFHLSHRFFSAGEMEKAKTYLEQVVALEPGHAPAWVQLADYYITGCFFGLAQPNELWPKAREAALRAVTADPEYADGQAAMGFTAGWGECKWAEAVSRVDTAVRLNPSSARAWMWRSQVLLPLGRSQEALECALRAVELDPLFLLYRQIGAERLLFRGEYDRAGEQALQMLELDPGNAAAYCLLGEVYSRMGRLEAAVTSTEKGVSLALGEFYPVGFMSHVYVAAGRRADAEIFVAGLVEKRHMRPVPAGTLALASLGLDDMAGTLRWFKQAIEERDPNLMYFVASPDFEPLRKDPRFQSLLEKMNLA